MEEISQEAIGRMVALVRGIAKWSSECGRFTTLEAEREICAEASAIVALMPKPIDPDVLEARYLCANDTADGKLRARYMAGELDRTPLVTMTLAGIRRGRELAKARAGEGSV